MHSKRRLSRAGSQLTKRAALVITHFNILNASPAGEVFTFAGSRMIFEKVG